MPDTTTTIAAELRATASNLMLLAARLLGEPVPESPPIALERQSRGLCVKCGEKPAEKGTRGACGACYQAVRRHVREHKTPDADLVRMGWLLPPDRGRPTKHDFSRDAALIDEVVSESPEPGDKPGDGRKRRRKKYPRK